MAKLYTKGSTVVDEIWASPRYDIKENNGTAFKSTMQIVESTSPGTAGTVLNAARMNNIETGLDDLDSKVAVIEAGTSGSVVTSIKAWLKTYFDTLYNALVAPSTTGNLMTSTGSAWSSSEPALPQGFLYGLSLSNNGSDATNDIDISTGQCRDITNAANIALASALTKRLDAAWSVGTNQGGLDTGSIANITYHVWSIKRSDTGVVDVLFSASASAPTLPTNYNYKRRIGSIMRESGAIVGFIQDSDYFYRKVPIRSSSVSNQATTASLITLHVPAGIRMRANIVASMFDASSTAEVNWLITDTTQTDSSPSGTLLSMYTTPVSTTSYPFSFLGLHVFTDTSGRIRSRVDTQLADLYLDIYVHGWTDTRGKDA
jgi:hypothetical protein